MDQTNLDFFAQNLGNFLFQTSNVKPRPRENSQNLISNLKKESKKCGNFLPPIF